MADKRDALGYGNSHWPEMLGKARNLNADGAMLKPSEAKPGLRSREEPVSEAFCNAFMLNELVYAARNALAALETPGDLSPDERRWVIEDLAISLKNYEKST